MEIKQTESNIPDPGTLEKWDEALENFKNLIYPTFAKFGFTFSEAYLQWQINTLKNAIYDVEDKLDNLHDLY